MRIVRFVIAAAAAVLSIASTGQLRIDPAAQLARVRLIVTGTAATTDVTVAGATLASYTSVMLRFPGGSSQTGSTMRMSNGAPGQRAEAQFDLILAAVAAGRKVTWSVATSESADTSVEVYSTNDPARPQLVDRFTMTGTAGQGNTDAARLASAGLVSVSSLAAHLVLAQYYPWYGLDSWRDPELSDQPLQPYSSDDQAAIASQTRQAQSAGIDAFVVSWQGRTNVTNDHRMRLVLDSAARAGTHACLYFETLIVNPTLDAAKPVDPATMVQWLEDAVDMYGSHPAYLTVNGRPVIFVYAASQLTEAQWASIRTTIRARGRDPIVIGDFFHSRLINVFDGEYQYINVSLSPVDLLDRYRTETLRVRTFNLLTPGDTRRIWVASVTPGYDDRGLTSRASHMVVDRASGALYDAQWRSAVQMAADWIVITTWNEYFENTMIEPSARYGSTYLEATKTWADTFKSVDRLSHMARHP